jgi:hypothetical protein
MAKTGVLLLISIAIMLIVFSMVDAAKPGERPVPFQKRTNDISLQVPGEVKNPSDDAKKYINDETSTASTKSTRNNRIVPMWNGPAFNPYAYLDGKRYASIANVTNCHKEDGYIQGATEINNGEDFAILWGNGKVRFYHESVLDGVSGAWNCSAPGKMIDHYKEFWTWGTTGIAEIPPGLWPGSYDICQEYNMSNASQCIRKETRGGIWGDIAVTDTDYIYFYKKDGTYAAYMSMPTDDIRDVAYDNEFNQFFITTISTSKILKRNANWPTFQATAYCNPPGSNNCLSGNPFSIKLLDMESNPLTYNMFISGYNTKLQELDGEYYNYDSNITNLGYQYLMTGKAYTNHYALECVTGGYFLYYSGYDPGSQKPNASNVLRFTAHLEKNQSYPYVKLISPPEFYNETANKTVNFQYLVNYSTQMDRCTLNLANVSYQTDYNVGSNTIQSFSQHLENGNYSWSVSCYRGSRIGASDSRFLNVNVSEPTCRGNISYSSITNQNICELVGGNILTSCGVSGQVFNCTKITIPSLCISPCTPNPMPKFAYDVCSGGIFNCSVYDNNTLECTGLKESSKQCSLPVIRCISNGLESCSNLTQSTCGLVSGCT